MINFGDTGYFVRYIQVFLKENYNPSLFVSGTYDTDTHENLLGYLSLPNVLRAQVVHQLMLEHFTTYNEYGNPVDGLDKYFDYIIGGTSIKYYTRNVTAEKINYIYNNIDSIESYANSCGWELTERPNINMENLMSIEIVISPANRVNYFPNQDMLYMVNQFCNDYVYGYAIRDSKGFDDQIHYADNYKLAIIPCNPGEVYTIAHGYSIPCEIAIGASTSKKTAIEEDISTVTNVYDYREGKLGKLSAGTAVTYTIPNDCYSLVIQMPYNRFAEFTSNTRITVMIGDVNQDGKIDQEDRDMLSDYLNGLLGYKFEGPQLIAANCCIDYDSQGNAKIDNRDLAYLDEYLEGSRVSLGIAYYDKPYSSDDNELNKLIVIKGDVGPSGSLRELNIPITSFYRDPWAVHECFLPYIARLCITPYSHPDDIAYAQNLLDYVIGSASIRKGTSMSTAYDEDKPGDNYVKMATGFFDDAYDREHSLSFKGTASMKDTIKTYQMSSDIPFALGYMDLNTELSMRNNIIGIEANLYTSDINYLSEYRGW